MVGDRLIWVHSQLTQTQRAYVYQYVCWRHIPIRRCMRQVPLPPTMHHEADHDHRGPSQEVEPCQNRPVAKFRNRGRLTPIVASDACTQHTNYACDALRGWRPPTTLCAIESQRSECSMPSIINVAFIFQTCSNSKFNRLGHQINIRHHYSVLKSDARFPSAVTSMLRID